MSAALRCELFPVDLDDAVRFYVDALGFTVVRDERGSPSPYVALERGAVRLGLALRPAVPDRGSRRPPVGVELVLEVDDLAADRDRVAAAGWPLVEDLTRRPWGLTDFRLLDPAGYYWRVTTRGGGPPPTRRGRPAHTGGAGGPVRPRWRGRGRGRGRGVGVRDYGDARIWWRLARRFGGSRPGTWFNARTLHHLDRLTHRLTGRRTTSTAVLAGLPVVMLTTTGARSGAARTVPLIGVPHGIDVAVIASNYGRARHPAWCHNLRADPHAVVEVGGERRQVVAEELTGAERDEVWQRGLRLYPAWADYARRAAHRDIAVFLLRPRRGG